MIQLEIHYNVDTGYIYILLEPLFSPLHIMEAYVKDFCFVKVVEDKTKNSR